MGALNPEQAELVARARGTAEAAQDIANLLAGYRPQAAIRECDAILGSLKTIRAEIPGAFPEK